MLEWLVGFMTDRALKRISVAQIDRVLKLTVLRREGFSAESLVDRRVANAAVVSDNLSFFTKMLSVVASETALHLVMPDVVGVRLPVGFHFGKEIRLINSLRFRDRAADRVFFRRVNVRVIRPVILVERGGDRLHGFLGRIVRLGQNLDGFEL